LPLRKSKHLVLLRGGGAIRAHSFLGYTRFFAEART